MTGLKQVSVGDSEQWSNRSVALVIFKSNTVKVMHEHTGELQEKVEVTALFYCS